MQSFVVEIELLSEAIFGNGESGNIDVDMEVLKDEYGIPYLKGKNFKGRLRQEAEAICTVCGLDCEVIKTLFGGKFDDLSKSSAKLRFSDCRLNSNVIDSLIYLLNSGKKRNGYDHISKDDITSAITDIRYFTKINENGVADEGSLRSARVIKKGIKLYCNINVDDKLSEEEKFLLAASVAALRNIGTLESRGKGNIKCRLLKKEKDNSKLDDVTLKYIESLERKC